MCPVDLLASGRLTKVKPVAVFSSNARSSNAYATEEHLLVPVAHVSQ